MGLVFGCLGSGGIRASAWVVESTTPAVRRQGCGIHHPSGQAPNAPVSKGPCRSQGTPLGSIPLTRSRAFQTPDTLGGWIVAICIQLSGPRGGYPGRASSPCDSPHAPLIAPTWKRHFTNDDNLKCRRDLTELSFTRQTCQFTTGALRCTPNTLGAWKLTVSNRV